MAVTLRRGPRERAPGVPTGRIVLQPPPEIAPSEGASGLLMNAVPMLGSVGSIAFVALSQPGVKGYIAAGMFLLASVGFVGVSGYRQRQQHSAGVIEARREYLAYLAEVRETVREAANRQRRAALWNTTSSTCGSVARASRCASRWRPPRPHPWPSSTPCRPRPCTGC